MLVSLEKSADDNMDVVIDTSGHETLPVLMTDVCVVSTHSATCVSNLPA